MTNLTQATRAAARWAILEILNAGRPCGVNGSVALRVLAEVELLNSTRELRRELDYLAGLGLVTVETDDNDALAFAGKLTAAGVDVVEYTAPAPAGIARPAKES